MTTILQIQALPTSPYEGVGIAAIVITSGIPSYFKITGTELDKITSVNWYPISRSSLDFEIRQLILLDNTYGTFMIKVTDNRLDTSDRGGHISFRLADNTTITYPVITYGPVAVGPLWQTPMAGLTG